MVVVCHLGLFIVSWGIFVAQAFGFGNEFFLVYGTYADYGVAEPLHVFPVSALYAAHHFFISFGHCRFMMLR